MRVQDGWLDDVVRCPSAHCNERPHNEVSLLVIHNISLPPGQFGGGYVQSFFRGQLDPAAHPYFAEIAALRVSAPVQVRTGKPSHCALPLRRSVGGEACGKRAVRTAVSQASVSTLQLA